MPSQFHAYERNFYFCNLQNTAASSTTPMPMTPSVTIVSSLNSTLAGISSSPLVNEELLSAVPSTAHSLSPKNHTSSSSSSSGTLSSKSTALTPQLNTVQGVGGSKASPDGGNEDDDDGGMSRPPVTISAQLPAPVGKSLSVFAIVYIARIVNY